MELKLSDEQYEKIGRESVAEWQKSCHPNTKSAYIAVGRKAVELSNAEVMPVVLGPVSPEEQEQAARSPRSTSCWYDVPIEERFSIILANRLARFTAPKDAAEDVLFDLEVKGTRGDGSVTPFKLCGSSIRQIVAAVRAADREARR